MPFRASPPRRVPSWDKTSLTAGEAAPAAAEDFVNLEASHIRHSGGFSHPVYALMPDKHFYERLRFSFGAATPGEATGATMAVYARHSDGFVSLIGRSVMNADGTFDSIEVENYQATYAAIMQDVDAPDTATDGVSLSVFVQGLHDEK